MLSSLLNISNSQPVIHSQLPQHTKLKPHSHLCRDRRKKRHPRTPDVHQVTSKRAFDGQVRKWRRALHEWDPEHTGINESNIPDDADETMPDFIDINNPQTDSKNFQGKRDPAHKGLPLKLQSALRPTNKRSYCAIASQKSLTTPISTQANNNNNNPQVQQTPMAFTLTSPPILPPGAKHVKTAHPQGGIATDWVVVNANGGTEIENEDVQGVESASDMQFDDGTMVCYSDDEGEGLQPMKLVV